MEGAPTTDRVSNSDLTQGQMLIWTGQQLHPGVPLYNMAFLFRIAGRVDHGWFAQAFGVLIDQCEALRTVIETTGDTPQQCVLETIDSPLDLVDLSSDSDPYGMAVRWSQTQCEQPFELDQRLFNTALIKLADEEYAWFFCQHHVVCDAWSVSVMYERLSLNYRYLASGQSIEKVSMPAYSKYVEFERAARLRGAATEYWQQVRERAVVPAPLYGRSATRVSTRSYRLACDLGVERSQRLRDVAQRPQARSLSADLSLFNLLATLLFAFLYRVSGQGELAIGAPAHNRPSPELKKTIGLFTEVYPLHVEVGEDDSFLALLHKVMVQSGTFLRFATPGASDPKNNVGCNAVLNYIHASFGDFAGSPVQTLWMHSGHKDRDHHLRLQVHDFGDSGRLLLYFDFNGDVFESHQRKLAVGHFLRLLDGMLDDWEQAIGSVDLLSADERQRLTADFNQTGKRRLAGDTVVRRFASQVAATPQAIALVCGDRQLTYAELNQASEQLAWSLLRHSINAKQRVAVCTRRSIEAIVAMLAVLRAGRAYVPVEPEWPRERLELVLSDAEISTVLVQRGLSLRWPDSVRTLEVPVTTELSRQASAEPLPLPDAGNLAYVMYTSGSTGKPKGVKISHRALFNYLAWASGHYCRGEHFSFPLFTPLTFDLTVTSIFVPLISGGRIVIYPETGGGADLSLLDVLDDDLVDIIKLTPSHLTMLQDRNLSGSRVRQLILGGEDLTVNLARQALDVFGGRVTIHNEYGPTEGTVGCIVHTFDVESDKGGSVPIGTPIENMQAYVLDRYRKPVAEGVVGELYIGGTGLAAGYSNRPPADRRTFRRASAAGRGEALPYR